MLIYAVCLALWALTVSPILTVLIYHFRMDGRFGDTELFGGGADGGVVGEKIFREIACACFHVRVH